MNENALYLRKSRGDPENETVEETLDRHKRTLIEFAKKSNLSITEVYCEVVSGDGLFVRPEMMRLLGDVQSRKYNGVICMDIDRLGRVDTKDRGVILDTFKETDTKIITPNKTYDLTDEIDEFSTEMQMLFARQELKKITKRLRTGLARTVEDGYHVGEPPYGYRRKYIDKKPTLEIYEEEAKIIRMIFDMYVNQHIGSHIIAETLNSMGVKPRKGILFSRNTVRFILANPVYIGKIVFNKRRKIKKKLPTDKFKTELNPEDKWIVVDGVHEPIIDTETFEQAQLIRKERSHPPSYTGEIKNPLAGLIRCANCGQLMSRQTSKKTLPRLICTTVGCNKSIVIWKVEEKVLESLRQSLDDCRAAPAKQTVNFERIKTLNESNTELKKQLSVLQKQNDNLFDLLEQGVYDIKIFTERSRILNLRMADVKKLIAQNDEELYTLNTIPRRQKILPLIDSLLENYDSMSIPEQNLALKKIVKNIYYKREQGYKGDFDIKVELKDWL